MLLIACEKSRHRMIGRRHAAKKRKSSATCHRRSNGDRFRSTKHTKGTRKITRSMVPPLRDRRTAFGGFRNQACVHPRRLPVLRRIPRRAPLKFGGRPPQRTRAMRSGRADSARSPETSGKSGSMLPAPCSMLARKPACVSRRASASVPRLRDRGRLPFRVIQLPRSPRSSRPAGCVPQAPPRGLPRRWSCGSWIKLWSFPQFGTHPHSRLTFADTAYTVHAWLPKLSLLIFRPMPDSPQPEGAPASLFPA